MENQEIREAVHNITYHPHHRYELFNSLDVHDQMRVLMRVSRGLRKELFLNLTKEQQIQLIEHLDPNDATDILQLIDKRKRSKILKEVQKNLQDDISLLLEFDPNSAAGIMSLNYAQVDDDLLISDVIEKIRIHERRTGKVPAILVLNKGVLKGFLPIHTLGLAEKEDKVSEHVRHIDTINHLANNKDVLEKIEHNPHEVLAVLKEENILGVIYSDDVLELLRMQPAKGLYDFAGLNQEESVFDPAQKKFNSRYKWLIINLGTAFLAAFTVGFFESTIAKHVLLAVYMPIVAGMGGNAATQTLAVMVRGLSTSKLPWWRILLTLKNEIVAGLLNGLINGAIVFVIVMVFNQDIKLALVLAFAMIINMFIAATFGTIVPVIMSKLGKDPASSATIFITTATDVFGFFAFLGLAALILG